MAGEVTLSDQRALLRANVAAALAGRPPVAVDRVIDVTIAELRAAGLTAVDAVVGYAKERPATSAAVVIGAIALIGAAIYFTRRGR